jgi:4-alpha-glucanotransferase
LNYTLTFVTLVAQKLWKLATDKLTVAPVMGEEKRIVAPPATKKRAVKPISKQETAAKNGHPAISEPVSKKAKTVKIVTPVTKTVTKKASPQKAAVKKYATKKAAPKKASVKKASPSKQKTIATGLQKIIFQLRFHTHYGQELFIVGDHPLLGNGVVENAVPLQYFNDEYWYLVLDLDSAEPVNQNITYHYVLRNADGILFRPE